MAYKINDNYYTDEQYMQMCKLIKKYDDARTNEYLHTDQTSKKYWQGVKDATQSILNEFYQGDWAAHGTIGRKVFYEMKTFREAITEINDQSLLKEFKHANA